MDSRESADPHPWLAHFSADVKVERGILETGDFALAALPDAAVVERKAVGDLLACLCRERERFERELQRSRYVGRLVVVCEGTVADLMCEARRRGGRMSDVFYSRHFGGVAETLLPVFLRRDIKLAAEFTERFLRGQIREVERASRAVEKAGE